MRDIQASVSRESQLQQAYSTKGLYRVSKVGWGGGLVILKGFSQLMEKNGKWSEPRLKKVEFFKIMTVFHL